MAKEFFKDLPNTTTPLSSARLNGLLDGEEAMGNIVVDSIIGKNLFNFNNITTLTNGANATNSINYTNQTISLTGYYHQTSQTLKELCPNMIAGNTYIISFTKSPSAVNNFIYLSGGGGIWNNGTSKTITQNDLNGKINLYGGAEGTTTEYVMSNIMIEKGSTVTSYTPYQNLNVQPDLLYNSSVGNNSSITVGKPLTNYYVLEIMYSSSDGTSDTYNSIRIYDPGNSKVIDLSLKIAYSTAVTFKNSKWTISGNTISFTNANSFSINSSGVYGFTATTNTIYIKTILGYK